MGLDPRAVLPVLLAGLALLQAGCEPETRPWTEPEELQVKVVSDVLFVRTSEGDSIDGFLAEYATDFEPKRMFMALEIPRYVKGERLDVTGRFTGASVRSSFGGRPPEKVPVFEVERAAPHVPKAMDLPPVK